MERLESRSMMAADIVEAAIDVVPDEPTVADQVEDVPADAVEAWGCDLPVCEPQSYDLVDQIFTVDASFIDDACLMVTDPAVPAFEPVDIRVQFVSSETDSSWAAYYYSVGADGLVQGVSVVASYDEPTIAAFVAEHADDPTVQISDYGDGWWIVGFPLDLAPPVPEYGVVSGVDDAAAYASTDGGTADVGQGGDVTGGWTWDESNGTYIWIDGSGTDGTGGDWYDSTPVFSDVRVKYVSSETQPGWASYTYTVGVDGVVQGVSVYASYDEPTIAAFVAEHADDPTVQISDYGDGWWIVGFPLELAPPVPDAVSWCGFGGGDPAAYESTDVGVWNPSGSFDIASDWSWDGSGVMYTWDQCTWDQAADFGDVGTSTWDGSGVLYAGDWSTSGFGCGVGMIRPLFYARGAGAGESFGDGIVAYSAAADAESGINELSGNVAVAEPVAVSPRAAAFADMGAMAAAATAMQAGSADAPPVGGRRRR